MKRYIIREYEPDYMDTINYFDCDSFDEKSGDYNNTLFIIQRERYDRHEGLNSGEFNRLREQCEQLFDGITEIQEHNEDYTWKCVCSDASIEYNPDIIPSLISYYDNSDGYGRYYDNECENVATLLYFQTGKTWFVKRVNGYCQGDVCYVIYCSDNYTNYEAYRLGEMWLGCYGAYVVIDTLIDDECYGYYLPDSDKTDDMTIKHKVCNMAGINPDETILQLIDGCKTITQYSYREC